MNRKMSVLDVFGKWALEKFDRKYIQEKELSVEEILRVLHGALLDVSEIAKYAANILNKMVKDDKTIVRYKFDLPSESVIKNRIKNVKDGVAELKTVKIKFEKTLKNALSKKGNRIRKLNFYFAREGQPNLLQKIAKSVGYVLQSLHIIETLLMPYIKSGFESEHRNNIRLSFLKEWERDFKNHAKKTDQIISQLLDITYKLLN